eukprot:TCALIF_09048-PA protein Name:"Protein of unknown function" AED:0.16 eAED:0.32 QI:0/0.57/0.37/1/0.85/0.75/8/0/553
MDDPNPTLSVLVEHWNLQVQKNCPVSSQEAQTAVNFLKHYPRQIGIVFSAKETFKAKIELGVGLMPVFEKLHSLWRHEIEPLVQPRHLTDLINEGEHLEEVSSEKIEPVSSSFDLVLVPSGGGGKPVQYQPSGGNGGLGGKVEARYFFGLCPTSLTIRDDMKACSGCLSVNYANKDAQKKDWRRHKDICKVLQPLVRQRPGHHPLSEKPELSGQIQAILQQALNRELTQFESDMLIYPRLCMVCLGGRQSAWSFPVPRNLTRPRFTSSFQTELFNCPICHCVSYCSQSHQAEDQEEHAKSCELLRVCLEDHQMEMIMGCHLTDPSWTLGSNSKGRQLGRGFQPRAMTMVSATPGLPSKIEQVFEGDLRTYLSFSVSSQDCDSAAVFHSEVRYLTFKYTCQLSTLHALETAGMPNGPIRDYTSLTLHVVGARSAESSEVMRWEILAAHLPLLQNLTIVLIGPELRDDSTYHDFVNSKAAKKAKVAWPDAISALNCGFIFYQSWDASIPSMLRSPGVPLIFTEYYLQDCQLNLDKVDDLVEPELEVTLEPQENPF